MCKITVCCYRVDTDFYNSLIIRMLFFLSCINKYCGVCLKGQPKIKLLKGQLKRTVSGESDNYFKTDFMSKSCSVKPTLPYIHIVFYRIF